MVAIFKCMSEIVNNKGQRASFGNNSAQGILLFREASLLGHAFASAPQASTDGSQGGDLYKTRYKQVACCLETLKLSLSGGYVNFGVMTLYGDTALIVALDAALRLLLSVPLEDALTFPKLSRLFFTLYLYSLSLSLSLYISYSLHIHYRYVHFYTHRISIFISIMPKTVSLSTTVSLYPLLSHYMSNTICTISLFPQTQVIFLCVGGDVPRSHEFHGIQRPARLHAVARSVLLWSTMRSSHISTLCTMH